MLISRLGSGTSLPHPFRISLTPKTQAVSPACIHFEIHPASNSFCSHSGSASPLRWASTKAWSNPKKRISFRTHATDATSSTKSVSMKQNWQNKLSFKSLHSVHLSQPESGQNNTWPQAVSRPSSLDRDGCRLKMFQ